MDVETLVVAVFFLLPGFVGLRFFQLLVTDDDLTAWEVTSTSLGISVVSAAPLLAFDRTAPLLGHLLSPQTLSAYALLGVTIHMLAAVGVAAIAAWVSTSLVEGRFRRSVFQTGWEWLWYRMGQDSRYVEVATDEARYFGALAFADNRREGRGLVLQDPAAWSSDTEEWVRTGMKYLLLDGAEIRTVQVSVANPPEASDEPIPTPGPIDDTVAESTEPRVAHVQEVNLLAEDGAEGESEV
jgi:hypothetical protein